MDLQQLKDRKRQLQDEVYRICKAFTDETGVKCDVSYKGYALDIDHNGNMADDIDFVIVHPVEVKLHL
jgi:hypothetical protein